MDVQRRDDMPISWHFGLPSHWMLSLLMWLQCNWSGANAIAPCFCQPHAKQSRKQIAKDNSRNHCGCVGAIFLRFISSLINKTMAWVSECTRVSNEVWVSSKLEYVFAYGVTAQFSEAGVCSEWRMLLFFLLQVGQAGREQQHWNQQVNCTLAPQKRMKVASIWRMLGSASMIFRRYCGSFCSGFLSR